MAPERVGVLGFAAMLLLLAMRMPVGLSMLAVSSAGYAYLVSPRAALARLGADPYAVVGDYGLSVIPMFVLMGLFLSHARLGTDLYEFVGDLLGHIRGGVAMATIGACALFAAVSGSAVATASTMAAVAVPEMRRHRYDDGLAAGCAAAGGTLGILIPPSGILVLYGILTEEPIGKVLIAGILPGVLAALLLMLAAYLVVRARPHLAPPAVSRPRGALLPGLRKMWPVPVIFGISMGGISAASSLPRRLGRSAPARPSSLRRPAAAWTGGGLRLRSPRRYTLRP